MIARIMDISRRVFDWQLQSKGNMGSLYTIYSPDKHLNRLQWTTDSWKTSTLTTRKRFLLYSMCLQRMQWHKSHSPWPYSDSQGIHHNSWNLPQRYQQTYKKLKIKTSASISCIFDMFLQWIHWHILCTPWPYSDSQDLTYTNIDGTA